MGLSTLEVAANTYITVLGDPKKGAMRLTFSQAFVSPAVCYHLSPGIDLRCRMESEHLARRVIVFVVPYLLIT